MLIVTVQMQLKLLYWSFRRETVKLILLRFLVESNEIVGLLYYRHQLKLTFRLKDFSGNGYFFSRHYTKQFFTTYLHESASKKNPLGVDLENQKKNRSSDAR